MTKKNNYNYPYPRGDEEIIRELSNPKYDKGNIALSPDADPIAKIKYSLCQSLLTHQQESKKSLAAMAKEIALADITEKKLYDICRGKISDFSLGELVVCAINLRIYFVPCLECGGNILPILLGELVHSLKKRDNLPTNIPNIHQALAEHQSSVPCHL